MRRLPVLMILLPLLAVPIKAQDGTVLPRADAFAPGSGRVWFSGCAFEAERYVTCKNADAGVLEAISNPGDGTPGLALQTYVSDVFIEKGCAFEAPLDTFRVNGVLLSFDSKAAGLIRCKGKPSKLSFAPGLITLADTLYFLTGDPPQ
jgi:hypothetical protein